MHVSMCACVCAHMRVHTHTCVHDVPFTSEKILEHASETPSDLSDWVMLVRSPAHPPHPYIKNLFRYLLVTLIEYLLYATHELGVRGHSGLLGLINPRPTF